jgi:glutamine amidotransferase
MKTAIIDYNAGNIQSVIFAMKRLNADYILTKDIDAINKADKVIFPGVGEASTTMKYLNDNHLSECIKSLKQPILGICLGLQLMCSHSEENDTKCLGIFPVKVKQFIPNELEKVPHIGWNKLGNCKGQIINNELTGKYCYFVHSFYAELCEYTVSTTFHTLDFSSALQKDNFFATQFHPEKSGSPGELILNNFLKM